LDYATFDKYGRALTTSGSVAPAGTVDVSGGGDYGTGTYGTGEYESPHSHHYGSAQYMSGTQLPASAVDYGGGAALYSPAYGTAPPDTGADIVNVVEKQSFAWLFYFTQPLSAIPSLVG
jgi:hypothetical protein